VLNLDRYAFAASLAAFFSLASVLAALVEHPSLVLFGYLQRIM
jgi:hypothetical protein